VDYTAPNIGREFGTVYLGDKNVAYSVVSAGWARVRTILPFLVSLFIVLDVLLISSICLIR
jgi:endonuclease YncB( thermonuclease family)